MATYLITGTNRGIGLAYVQELKKRGEDVVAVCREPSAELKDVGVRIEAGVDVSSDEQVADLAQRLEDTKIDVLINNAGIIKRDNLDDLDFDSLLKQFDVNTLGALRVTKMLLPQLASGAKIALMTSRMGSIEDNSSGGYYGYRLSKSALCMAGKSLAIDLKPKQIAVAILHPGMIKTRMTNFSGNSPQEAVQGLLARIEALNMSNSGTFWHANGEILPW